MGKYRFGQWRVVDIDNFMKGNSPFREHKEEEEVEEIFKNTVIDKSYYCNIRNIWFVDRNIIEYVYGNFINDI